MNGLSPLAISIVLAAGLIVTAANQAVLGSNVDNLALEWLVLLAVATATTTFEADDPPRGAWLTLTLAVALIAIAHVLTPFTPNRGTVTARHVFTFAHNVVWVVAFWHLDRVFRRGGIARPWTPAWRAAFPGVVACGVAVATWGIWCQARSLLDRGSAVTGYDLSLATVNASSGVANAFVLVIAVDLTRTLLPLRGGTLAQPYVLLAFGAGVLLVSDLIGSITQIETFLVLGPAFQYMMAIAWISVGAAGLSQARIARGVLPREGPSQAAADEATRRGRG